jgi:Protein of unknown function (DUF3348)
MERALPRTSLQGSALVGCLSQLGLIEGSASRPSFVEGMGRWLGWTDAIHLAAALQGPPAPEQQPASGRPGTADTPLPIERELARVRAAWVRSIDELSPATSGGARRRAGLAAQRSGMVTDSDFAAHRRRYLELQRSMEAGIGTLRAQARRAAAAASGTLGSLAALDAALAEVVSPREQAVLATLPGLLQGHFERLQQSHDEADAATAVTTPAEPPWLDHFRKDMQRVLHAELELRLQPVLGLIEALRSQQQGNHE